MVIKLCLLIGTAELIGLVQIPNSVRRNEFEVIVNVIFGMVYNFLRSSRGIFMFVLFSYNRVFEKNNERSRTSSSVNENLIHIANIVDM